MKQPGRVWLCSTATLNSSTSVQNRCLIRSDLVAGKSHQWAKHGCFAAWKGLSFPHGCSWSSLLAIHWGWSLALWIALNSMILCVSLPELFKWDNSSLGGNGECFLWLRWPYLPILALCNCLQNLLTANWKLKWLVPAIQINVAGAHKGVLYLPLNCCGDHLKLQ